MTRRPIFMRLARPCYIMMQIGDDMMRDVRTTVNIDEHLLAEAKVLAARQRRSLGEIIDDALRVTLARTTEPKRRSRIVLPTSGDPHAKPLVDINDKEALAEALGDNEWPRRDD